MSKRHQDAATIEAEPDQRSDLGYSIEKRYVADDGTVWPDYYY